MIVTLDIFSGRRNPSWRLSEKLTSNLTDRVAQRAVAVAEAEGIGNVLGFRGLVLASNNDSDSGPLPPTFRVGGSTPLDESALNAGYTALSAEETEETVQWLLSTGAHVLGDDLAVAISDEIAIKLSNMHEIEPSAESIDDSSSDFEAAASCVIANTSYNPAFWNAPAVQPHNNCYNYAMNFRSDTFAQPGRISGHPNSIMSCVAVSTAANWDGCKATCSGSNKNVALVVWPGVDYHWYRKHSQGFWGHKPGSTAARNTDNSGAVINGTSRTPANCNRGPYTNFCGYRFSPTGMKVR